MLCVEPTCCKFGVSAAPADQVADIEAKYYARIGTMTNLHCTWAMKIIIINVFLRSLWSYMMRHVLVHKGEIVSESERTQHGQAAEDLRVERDELIICE